MAKLKQGDAVVIVAREATPQDVKSGLYYAHYARLSGTILKLYGEEAAVLVDRESLSREVRARHEEGEKAMRNGWLEKLSETARTGMSEREKNFSLNYAVLVSVNDLQPDRSRGGAAKSSRGEAATVGGESMASQALARATAADLDAKEEEFLKQRAAADATLSNGTRKPGKA